MKRKGCFQWLRNVWAPKRVIAAGSLYDISLEEKDRHQTQLDKSLAGLQIMRNDVYESHETVMEVCTMFKYALWDALRHLNWNQSQMYNVMCTVVGRCSNTHNVNVVDRAQSSERIQLADTLRTSVALIRSVETSDPTAGQRIVSGYLMPIKDEFQKMAKIMDKLCDLFKSNLEYVTPVMQSQSLKVSLVESENLERRPKNHRLCMRKGKRLYKNSSESLYDPTYSTVVSERSTSAMAWTLSAATDPEPVAGRSKFCSKAISRLGGLCIRFRKNTRKDPSSQAIVVKPVLKNVKPTESQHHQAGAIGLPREESVVTKLSKEVFANENANPLPSHQLEFVPVSTNAQQGYFETPNGNLKCDEEQNQLVKVSFTDFDLKDKPTTLTSEDLNLANTEESSGSSCLNPLSDILVPLSQVTKTIFSISKIISEVDEKHSAVPVRFINLKAQRNATRSMTFDHLLKHILQSVHKIDKVAYPKIYDEEESVVRSGIEHLFLEILKCSELFISLSTMLRTVEAPLRDLNFSMMSSSQVSTQHVIETATQIYEFNS